MPEFHVKGPCKVEGSVTVSGAKNAALPMIAASLLSDEEINLKYCPNIGDVRVMMELISPWKSIAFDETNNTLNLKTQDKPMTMCLKSASKIRASILLLGALIARTKRVVLPFPGGCSLGKRGIDMHLEAMQKFGVRIILTDNEIIAVKEKERLSGAQIDFSQKTVGGTENAILAACLAEGETIITNAAQEPEIVNLAEMLNAMGANIQGVGSDRLVIEGVSKLNGLESFDIIGDRIEAGTFLVAAAMTNGSVTVNNINPDHLTETLLTLRNAGAEIETDDNTIQLSMQAGNAYPIDVKTSPYPGLATDMQSLLLTLATQLGQGSKITETVFSKRFQLVEQLEEMGASIDVDGQQALVSESRQLSAALVKATDLRAGAALVCAALCAEGNTIIQNAEIILRGYENLSEKFHHLGCKIELRDAALSYREYLGRLFPPNVAYRNEANLHDKNIDCVI